MNKVNKKYVTMGKVGAPYGIHGWLKIYSYATIKKAILDYQPWYCQDAQDQHWYPIEIAQGKIHGDLILVKFAGIENPEEARQMTGKWIGIPREQLPSLKENEYYWSDLMGLSVINNHGELLGKVHYLMATGSNDVLVVKGVKEYAIPYLPGTVVKKIDLDKQEIEVDWDV